MTRGATSRGGMVMICDVDLEMPDATRTHTVEVARCFAAEGFDVDLVTRGSDPGLTGVRHHRARGSETGSGRARRITDLTLRSLYILCTRRRSADKCYVRQKWSNVAIVLAARLLGYRVVTQVDDLPYERDHRLLIPFLDDRVKRLATILMSRLSHGIVAVTPEIKALLIDEFRTPAERIAALPNGVDIDFFHPLPRAEAIARAGLDPDCRYAVFCGNFQPWVDFDTLLEAFSIVASRLTDARLILVGDGPERELVDGEIRRLGIGDSVLKTGFVRDRAAVRDLIGSGHCYVVGKQIESSCTHRRESGEVGGVSSLWPGRRRYGFVRTERVNREDRRGSGDPGRSPSLFRGDDRASRSQAR